MLPIVIDFLLFRTAELPDTWLLSKLDAAE
jgi:hypothetical protein